MLPPEISRLVPGLKQTGSEEFSGPCPWCGGIDRFIVWVEISKVRYWCRKCLESGDSIDLLLKSGLSYREAFNSMGETSKNIAPTAPKVSNIDRTKWETQATNFAKEVLTKKSKEWTELLRIRALSEDFATTQLIGWNNGDRYFEAALWGFSEKISIFIPKGLVIPTWKNDIPPVSGNMSLNQDFI